MNENSNSLFAEDEVCATCGALIGGGCPESTDEERIDFVARHPENEEGISCK
jgi:hypothetical protein